ncbi:FUSC family protein [Tatumella sp. JGM118]|uniref:FUSC family protein n=1 Tax=Tatumella sp. JGM118 TaxID=2799796 RepID=UPI001BB0A754|nr:FUSC family protein [Tatumella sp. JGM118]MBS0909156.1 FUSC family protein [Tatumella sp. JGM118]
MIITDHFFNKKLFIGGTLSIVPSLLIYLLTGDQKFIIGSIASISFFYMLATEADTKKILYIIPITYLLSMVLLFLENNASVMTYPFLIIISFLSIIFRMVNLNKSTGLYVSVIVLFFAIPVSHYRMSPLLVNYLATSSVFLISTLPPVMLFLYSTRFKDIKNENGYTSQTEIVLESTSLLISTVICAAIASRLHGYDAPMLMWSCIVVNSCRIKNSGDKLKDRIFPGIAGVCIGYIIGIFLKNLEYTLLISSYITMLSLISFKNYSVGFFIRCVSFPVGVCALYQSDNLISARVTEIFLGGCLSFISVFLVALFSWRRL